jgi:hypothetical protein
MAENSSRWHTHAPNLETTELMLRELSSAYDREYVPYSKADLPVKKEVFSIG